MGKFFKNFFGKEPVLPIQAPFDEIKKRCRILIIDDKEFEYQTLFERDGYTITKWTVDDDIDIEKIDNAYFDIVLLDVDGVATNRSEKHGLGLLKYIKEKNPAQVVILYSAKSFSLDDHSYVKMADDSLKKSADYYEFKKRVDSLLETRTSISFYLSVANNIVKNDKIIYDINSALKQAIMDKNSIELRKVLENLKIGADIVEKLLAISMTAIKFFS